MSTTYDPALMLRRACYYLKLGMALTPVRWGGKVPVFGTGWNKPENLIRDTATAEQWFRTPHNIGVNLGASLLVSFDLDDLDLAEGYFAAHGLDLLALIMEHPHAILGKGVRLWFRVSEDCPIQTRRHHSVAGVCAFEIRGGYGFQDVAPGSLHPDGFEYRWAENAPRSREDLPELPGFLLDLFGKLKDRPEGPKSTTKGNVAPVGNGIIGRFNACVTVEEALERNGYLRRGDRYLSPNSGSKLAGVKLYLDAGGKTRARSFHGSDEWSDDHGHDAFDLCRILEHGGNFGAAIAAARELLGEKPPSWVEPSDVAAAWDEDLVGLLGRVSDGLADVPMNHNARSSLKRLTEYLYAEAAFGAVKYVRGRWCVMVGGLRGLKEAGVTGHASDISARLKGLAELGLLEHVGRVDEHDPYAPLMIAVPATPGALPFLALDKAGRQALRPTLDTKGTRRAAGAGDPAGTDGGTENADSPPTKPSEATPGGRVRLLTRLLWPVLLAERDGKAPKKAVRTALEAEGLTGATYRDLKDELRRERDCDAGVRFAVMNRLEMARERLKYTLRLARFGVATAVAALPRAKQRLLKVTERLERLRDGEPMSVVMAA